MKHPKKNFKVHRKLPQSSATFWKWLLLPSKEYLPVALMNEEGKGSRDVSYPRTPLYIRAKR